MPVSETYSALLEYLSALDSLAVAFSGGVDSAFLLKAAHNVLGSKVLAITAVSASFPERELNEAVEFCTSNGIRQAIIHPDQFSIPGFSENPPDRCYICKHAIFSEIKKTAALSGIYNIAEGSNMDDTGDYRPGLRAIEDLGILSPLRHCGMYKKEIRSLSKELGLPVWDKPAYACLATRIPYGDIITPEKLKMIEKGEELLINHGFRQMRVRLHGDIARIELLPEQIDLLLDKALRTEIYAQFKELGFRYTALDLAGYRTGSMNEVLKK